MHTEVLQFCTCSCMQSSPVTRLLTFQSEPEDLELSISLYLHLSNKQFLLEEPYLMLNCSLNGVVL